ncbi:hypothetical protein LINGRAHAP2_LOCUS32631 [Linum grandiflorum]
MDFFSCIQSGSQTCARQQNIRQPSEDERRKQYRHGKRGYAGIDLIACSCSSSHPCYSDIYVAEIVWTGHVEGYLRMDDQKQCTKPLLTFLAGKVFLFSFCIYKLCENREKNCLEQNKEGQLQLYLLKLCCTYRKLIATPNFIIWVRVKLLNSGLLANGTRTAPIC